MTDSLRPHGLQPTGSTVHEIFQARILEWVTISFSKEVAYKYGPLCMLIKYHLSKICEDLYEKGKV